MNIVTKADLAVLEWIQENMRCGFLDSFLSFITTLGDGGFIWILLAAALILIPRTRKYGLTAAAALIIGALICNVTLKPLIARIHPFKIVDTVRVIIPLPMDYSFPSGHTTSSFAAAFALMLTKARGWPAAVLLASVIAFSRLYLFVHYPSDVLAGVLIGLAAAEAGRRLLWRNGTAKSSTGK